MQAILQETFSQYSARIPVLVDAGIIQAILSRNFQPVFCQNHCTCRCMDYASYIVKELSASILPESLYQ